MMKRLLFLFMVPFTLSAMEKPTPLEALVSLQNNMWLQQDEMIAALEALSVKVKDLPLHVRSIKSDVKDNPVHLRKINNLLESLLLRHEKSTHDPAQGQKRDQALGNLFVVEHKVEDIASSVVELKGSMLELKEMFEHIKKDLVLINERVNSVEELLKTMPS